jgi:hypothetical protein
LQIGLFVITVIAGAAGFPQISMLRLTIRSCEADALFARLSVNLGSQSSQRPVMSQSWLSTFDEGTDYDSGLENGTITTNSQCSTSAKLITRCSAVSPLRRL